MTVAEGHQRLHAVDTAAAEATAAVITVAVLDSAVDRI